MSVRGFALADITSPSTAPGASTAAPATAAAVNNPPSPRHIRYAEDSAGTGARPAGPPLSIDPLLANQEKPPPAAEIPPLSGQGGSSRGPESAVSPTGPSLRRRPTRALTFRNVDDFSDYEMRPGWQPGAEPGIDTMKPDGGREMLALMKAPSDITVVDFGETGMNTTRLQNDTLAGFLATPRPSGMTCRWINVNGLSWDVIQILGNYKSLHRLAIEDLINTRNRTKADWYPTHMFMVLTLQKLVHIDPDEHGGRFDNDSSSSSGDDEDGGPVEATNSHNSMWSRASSSSRRSRRSVYQKLRSWLGRSAKKAHGTRAAPGSPAPKTLESGPWQRPRLARRPAPAPDPPDLAHVNTFRTLQRYHASPNDVRIEFMERHSALSSRQLAVAAEQVSIFITNDNTVVSFFELSAQDVEQPILTRLQLPDTSLRRSCDASMVAQAILDAIVDLAIPVTVCYSDVIADLELDVLTRPRVNHTKSLYVTITEINKVLSFINPVMNLINTLRDHKTDHVATDDFQNPDTGVIISPTTHVYLADVLDHCVLITESLAQTKGQAENMISLIFNTISASQNESMMQLTIITIIFLPLTFLTGYFGQNFDGFSDLQRGTPFFWMISAPVIFFTVAIMMYDVIIKYIKTLIQRRHILSLRKYRQKSSKRRKQR